MSVAYSLITAIAVSIPRYHVMMESWEWEWEWQIRRSHHHEIPRMNCYTQISIRKLENREINSLYQQNQYNNPGAQVAIALDT